MKAFSVSQFNSYVSKVLVSDPLLMRNVSVQGEISQISTSRNGHMYFTLKDPASLLSCVIWASNVDDRVAALTAGMEIVATGRIRVYEQRGEYQLNVSLVEPVGAGDLAEAFAKMKAKLEAEGLFDEAHKKPLPYFPHRIAVVTSETGAAVQDIKKTIRGKNDVVSIYVFPVLVQGERAAADIADTIRYINAKRPDMDLMIVGRGGGAPEDLAPFNDEDLARAIYDSKIPVISAVGHETDVSISDFVADRYARTPTAAGEMAVPDTFELAKDADACIESMAHELENRVYIARARAENEKKDLIASASDVIRVHRNEVDGQRNRIVSGLPDKVYRMRQRILGYSAGLTPLIVSRLQKERAAMETLPEGMLSAATRRTERLRNEMERYGQTLQDNDMRSLLKRGYSIVRNRNGAVVTDPSDLNEKERIGITMAGGKVAATVEKEESDGE